VRRCNKSASTNLGGAVYSLLARKNFKMFVSYSIHRDLGVATVRDIFQAKTTTHRTALAGHPNPPMRPLLATQPPRRLKRTWTFDAVS
jgi:hypothetical protein